MSLVSHQRTVHTGALFEAAAEQRNSVKEPHGSNVAVCNSIQRTASPMAFPAWVQSDNDSCDEGIFATTGPATGTPQQKIAHECQSPVSVLFSTCKDGLPENVNRRLCLESPATPPSISRKEDNLGRAPHSRSLEDMAVSDMTIMDFQDAQQESSSSDFGHPGEEFPTLPKRVSFADDWGSPLKQVHVLEPPPYRRIVLLLLSPEDRKFEFLNLEYPLDDSTTVLILLEQIPKLVANPIFRMLSFSCLAKTSKNEKLDNNVPLAHCDLKDNELLLGILTGYSMNQIGGLAVPLLLNGDIIKAVSRAKRNGKGLKTIKSGKEWRRRGKLRRSPDNSARKAAFPFDSTGDAMSLDSKLAEADNSTNAREEDPVPSDAGRRISNKGKEYTTSDPSPANVALLQLESQIKEKEALEPVLPKDGRNSLESNARSVVEQLVDAEEEEVEEEVVTIKTMTGSSQLSSSSTSTVPELQGATHHSIENECNTSSEVEDVPDIDQPGDDSWKYPDLFRDYLGGPEGPEKAVFWIHAMSIAAVGYFTAVTMG